MTFSFFPSFFPSFFGKRGRISCRVIHGTVTVIVTGKSKDKQERKKTTLRWMIGRLLLYPAEEVRLGRMKINLEELLWHVRTTTLVGDVQSGQRELEGDDEEDEEAHAWRGGVDHWRRKVMSERSHGRERERKKKQERNLLVSFKTGGGRLHLLLKMDDCRPSVRLR